jgi:hypothetical protein
MQKFRDVLSRRKRGDLSMREARVGSSTIMDRPGCGDEPFLGYEVAGGFDEHSEDRKRPAANARGRPGVSEELSASRQFKAAEPVVCVASHNCDVLRINARNAEVVVRCPLNSDSRHCQRGLPHAPFSYESRDVGGRSPTDTNSVEVYSVSFLGVSFGADHVTQVGSELRLEGAPVAVRESI